MSNQKSSIFQQLYGPQSDTNQTDQAAISPISTHPESGPAINIDASEYAPIQEYVEPEIPPEMSAHIQLSQPPFKPIQDVPILPTNHSVPIISSSQLNLPIKEDQIEPKLKLDIFNAVRWLAEWCIRQLKIEQSNNPPPPQESGKR